MCSSFLWMIYLYEELLLNYLLPVVSEMEQVVSIDVNPVVSVVQEVVAEDVSFEMNIVKKVLTEIVEEAVEDIDHEIEIAKKVVDSDEVVEEEMMVPHFQEVKEVVDNLKEDSVKKVVVAVVEKVVEKVEQKVEEIAVKVEQKVEEAIVSVADDVISSLPSEIRSLPFVKRLYTSLKGLLKMMLPQFRICCSSKIQKEVLEPVKTMIEAV